MMRDFKYNFWTTGFAALTALSTLALIMLGGLVTSHGVGMAVPDWPTSYGYNMFAFPISKWVGGVFYEHTHRLVATYVGTLVVILTRWLGGRQACKPLLIVGLVEIIAGFALLKISDDLKGAGYFLSGIGGVVLLAGCAWVHNERAEGALPKLGWICFWLVQIQGLLGGLRVSLHLDQIGIVHAALAQMFFTALCVIVLMTTQWWKQLVERRREAFENGAIFRVLFPAVTLIIFAQLILGATMRHQHAGLAIPDFPLAYHKIWPPMDAESVARYNALRMDPLADNPITAFQIALQMAHRIMALVIFCAVISCAWLARRNFGPAHAMARWSLLWAGMILLQVVLGAATIWTNKAADIATAHMVLGALSLAFGTLLTLVSFRLLSPACVSNAATVEGGVKPVPAAGAS